MWIEDFERIPELDQMYLREKEQDMFVEWQQWEEEQEMLNRQPAKIAVTIEEMEVKDDSSCD